MITANVPLRAVLWDFDGVLNDNAPQGRFLWTDDFEGTFGQPLDGFVDAVFCNLESVLTGREDLLDRIGRWIETSGAETTPETVATHWLEKDFHPNTAVLDAVARLARQGYRQAILTNADLRRAAWVEGIAERIDGIEAVYASARLGHAKPDATAFRKVLDDMGLSAGEVLFVDDDSTNVNAAAALGFRTFRYSRLAHDALEWSLPR
ncbi:HAD-IA family hydrolase [Jannaschia marina]|uniref:HAD-IA family hydrolase n=1 Tax=Jannaschia marina TaxID=2741674 RepID=UPI0015CBF21C|nr:HAD-IA family hydrolase [Jannaschia marina]